MMLFIYSMIFLLTSVADSVAGFEGGNKHEIYAAAYGSHLFYDLFSQSRGGAWSPWPPRVCYCPFQMFVFHCEDITCISNFSIKIYIKCLNESIQNQIVLYFRKLKTQNVCKISCGRLILNTNQSEVADPGGGLRGPCHPSPRTPVL